MNLATPAVRHMIKSKNLDINKIKATGKDNRILKEDVINYLKNIEESSNNKHINKSAETKEQIDEIMENVKSKEHTQFSDRARMSIKLDSGKSIMNKIAFILSLISCFLTLKSYHKTVDELIITHDHECYMYFFVAAMISNVLSILIINGNN